jgi:peroxiredoxin
MDTLGNRCKRFAAIIEDNEIKTMFVDEKEIDKSSAENILKSL